MRPNPERSAREASENKALPPSDDQPLASELDDGQLAEYDEWLRRCADSDEASDLPGCRAEPPEELAGTLRFLERAWPRGDHDRLAPSLPKQIGRFEIERILGTGGFGIVYLANDPLLHRQIALKVPRTHWLADSAVAERFRREAWAAAKLDHPHIVPIYETSESGPLCYIASAYCPGPTLAEWLKEFPGPVPVRLAASLIACLADAVHYSHSQGVLHRDIKPGNVILVLPSDADTPKAKDLPFTPRLTDFGLAKLREEELTQVTMSSILGTPTYMAPEQTGNSGYDVGPPTDVYALGAMLYELLTGRPPFISESVSVLLDQVRKEEPLSVHQLRREVPRDLQTICLVCLEKSPSARYATAQQLAVDLRRFLKGETLLARRPGHIVTVQKWIRRRPLVAALCATITVSILCVTGLSLWSNQRLSHLAEQLQSSLVSARRLETQSSQSAHLAELRTRDAEVARELALQEKRTANRVAYASAVRMADQARREGDIRHCRLLLEAAQNFADDSSPPGVEWSFLDDRTRVDFRELGNASGTQFCVDVSATGEWIASGGEGGSVHIMDVALGKCIQTLATHHSDVRNVSFDASGGRLAVCGELDTASVWDVKTGQCLSISPPLAGPITCLAWLLDDEWLACGGSFADVRLWHVGQRGDEAIRSLGTDGVHVRAAIAIDDGRQICAGGRSGITWIWDARSGQLLDRLDRDDAIVSAVAYSETCQMLAVGLNARRVDLYERRADKCAFLGELPLSDDVRGIAFSPDGKQLAVLEQFGALRLWAVDQRSGTEQVEARVLRGWLAHEERGSQVAFLPDGQQAVSVGRGSFSPRLWSGLTEQRRRTIPGVSQPHFGLQLPLLFSPDSTRLIGAHENPHVWSLADTQTQRSFGQASDRRDLLALSTDGRWLAAADNYPADGQTLVETWDQSLTNQTTPTWRLQDLNVDCLAFSPSTNLLAAACWNDDAVLLFDRESGERRHALPAQQCHQVAFSPDGGYLAADELDDVVIWDTSTWTRVALLKGHLSTILAIRFSPDGRWLSSAGKDREIRLWDVRDWSLTHSMPGHRVEIRELCWTDDSRLLLSLDAGQVLKTWDPVTGLELAGLRDQYAPPAWKMAISPDSRHLAVRLWDGSIEIQQLSAR